ncbi:DUF2975 domain-containing protein [Sphingomonas sp. CGMCC 1.13654]|uniref:DUF2975 domain-containing protein n=1 Tax=Sphingomonas chungangi TaxID=2683589 RepID=A0A838L8X1_9SPHN|nr:DUF2975 domain-containing protein [Sphingomonas chungangi]MBA2935145.1 DUF2975 domain-containing protein [Sphingomonas chungangi]MVW57709.1 DUF2975 domain-containing protein [Sphingomonas chungangi]
MMRQGKLVHIAKIVVQLGRGLNGVFAAIFVFGLVFSVLKAPAIDAQLTLKYGPRLDVETARHFFQGVLLLGLPAVYATERLFASLRAILATVGMGDTFSAANAARIRLIGWMLLTLQLVDVALGVAAGIARSLRLDFITWTPSFTGWLAVLVAFVLAQVFSAGTRMRDELEGVI